MDADSALHSSMISWITPELVNNFQFTGGQKKQTEKVTHQKMVLPAPATGTEVHQVHNMWKGGRRTFPIYPQQRRDGLPFLVNTTLEEPGRSPFMLGTAGSVVICRGIWGREPFSNLLSRQLSCKGDSTSQSNNGELGGD